MRPSETRHPRHPGQNTGSPSAGLVPCAREEPHCVHQLQNSWVLSAWRLLEASIFYGCGVLQALLWKRIHQCSEIDQFSDPFLYFASFGPKLKGVR